MPPSNDLTKHSLVEVTADVSHRAEIRDKAETASFALGQESLSLNAVGNPTPHFNTAAVTVYQPPSSEPPKIWAIWNQTQVLTAQMGHAYGDDVIWEWRLPSTAIRDTEGNLIRSAHTPSLTVLDGQMHLIVVKPDGRFTLAHYVYIDSLDTWEYNSGWDVQPVTTASPSVTAFSTGTSNLLYLAFIAGDTVNVCTYTPSTTPGVKYGTWSIPVDTGVQSARAPALFTLPRSTGAELHLAIADSGALIKEYAMGNGIAEWTLSDPQPSGTTNVGLRACISDRANEAFLTAATADTENPAPQYTVWTEDGGIWSPWKEIADPSGDPLLPVFSDVACGVFNRKLFCFYIGRGKDSIYGSQVASVPVFGR